MGPAPLEARLDPPPVPARRPTHGRIYQWIETAINVGQQRYREILIELK